MHDRRVFHVLLVVVSLPSKNVFRTGDNLTRRAFLWTFATSAIVRRAVDALALGLAKAFFNRPSSTIGRADHEV